MARQEDQTSRRSTSTFSLFVETHTQSVYRLAFELTRSHYDAEDLAQEVFLKAYRSFEGFRGEAAPDTWLYRITVNTYLNSRRKKALRFLTLRNNLADWGRSGDDASRGAEAEVIRQHVDRVMKKLSPRERTAFVLRCENRLSLRETAAAMDIAEGTVKSLQHRALTKLRQELSFMDPR